jgi:PPOX class probable F420-dependent enzyme
MIDLTTPLGLRAAEHLSHDPVVWLTTISADGTPQPAPVWFVWDGASLLIYSQPVARRLKNIARSPRVSAHFHSDPDADEVVVLTGEARLDPASPPADQVAAYLAKYDAAIVKLGMTRASFAADYSVPFRMWPSALRGDLG